MARSLFNHPESDALVQQKLLEHSVEGDDLKYFAAIGSRNTPGFHQDNIMMAANYAVNQGYILRSGGAHGADQAAEMRVAGESNKEIFLPWPSFNKHRSKLVGATNAARKLALELHPNPKALDYNSIRYLGRNMHQILGADLKRPVSFVLAYTVRGKYIGGTATALRCADKFNIPVLNFGNMTLAEIREKLNVYITQ